MEGQTQIEALTMPVADPATELERPPPLEQPPPELQPPEVETGPPPAEPDAAAEIVRIPLRELEDGQRVRGVYAVRTRELRRKRNGDAWLRLSVGDATGTAEAVCWEGAEEL